ncbi:LysR substrate-binding domain-containing protein [Pseudomonas sp. PCH446]
MEEPLVLITPATLQVEDVLATIVEEPFIRFSRKVVGGKLVEAYLQGYGLKPKSQFELDGIDIIVKFVAEGLGVALVPDRPAANHEAQGVRRWEVPGRGCFAPWGLSGCGRRCGRRWWWR